MLDPLRTALLVIDMQRDFCDPAGYAAQAGLDVARLASVAGNIARLIDAARNAGTPVIYTREGHLPDLSDCTSAKLLRSRAAGAEIGSREGLERGAAAKDHEHAGQRQQHRRDPARRQALAQEQRAAKRAPGRQQVEQQHGAHHLAHHQRIGEGDIGGAKEQANQHQQPALAAPGRAFPPQHRQRDQPDQRIGRDADQVAGQAGRREMLERPP